MEVKVEMNRETYLKAVKAGLLYGFKIRSLIASGFAIVFATMHNIDNFTRRGFFIDVFVVLPGFIVLSYLIVFARTYGRLRASLRRLGDNTYIQVFTLTPDGISIDTERGDQFYRWFEIAKVSSIPGYLYIHIANTLIYTVPTSAFATAQDAAIFLETARSDVRNTGYQLKSNLRPPYLLGLLCLIPLIGAFVGVALILYGIIKYKDKWLVVIGTAGVVFTVAVYSGLYYFTAKSDLGKQGFARVSQMEVNALVKQVEFYKLQKGVYPDSLQQLDTQDEFVNINDPLQNGTNGNVYNYRRIGKKYTLFSSGVDEKANTKDDIYPSIKIDTSKIGLIKRN